MTPCTSIQPVSYTHLKLKPICKQYNVPLIINDNVKLAKEIDADGVHLGQEDVYKRQVYQR